MSQNEGQKDDRRMGEGLCSFENLRYRLRRWLIRPTPIWSDARRLGLTLETQWLATLQEENEESLILRVGPEGQIQPRFPAGLETESDDPFSELGRFLLSVGIVKLDLDARLESNQFTDLITLLYSLRKPLSKQSRRGAPAKLRSDQGLLFACTRTRIFEESLEVRYTYCMGALSRVLQWFKRTSGHFNDHRALYRVAPRYALLVALIAVLHLFTFWLTDNWWVVLVATLVEASALFVLVYMVLMAVGSLEYDNEEKSYRLGRAYGQLQKYTRRIQDDLSRARKVQQQLLPNLDDMPLSDRLEWAAHFQPESEIGGDYFDCHLIDSNRLAVIFCDVSGHGMSAAFVTAIIKTAFQGWVESNETMVDFAQRLNRRLCRNTPVESFAAIFLAVYDADSSELEYVNCGHNPEPWILSGSNGRLECLDDARGMLMGVIEEGFPLHPRKRRLKPGEVLVMTTDGAIEETSPEGDLFGRERLETLLRSLSGNDAQQIVDRVFQEVHSFSQDTPQNDDCTVLAMRVRTLQTAAKAGPTSR